MKVLVLGGAGAMGRRAVEDLALCPDITVLTVADINMQAATELVNSISSAVNIKALQLDAFQHAEVVAAMTDHDLVVSALGPYYIFEERMVQAALEAGVNYISICDEWDVMEKVQAYNEEARTKQIQIVCGMGASPGITNLGAMYLAAQLEAVKRIDISVYLPLDTGAGAAAIQHGVYIMTDKMAIWRNGARQLIEPCTEKQVCRFPGMGKQKVWNMGHSEPLTLPANVPGVEEVNFYMGFGAFGWLLTGPARLGWYKRPKLRKALTNFFIWSEHLMGVKNARPGASRIDVYGEAAGKEQHLVGLGVATMQESTALTLSVGAQMMIAKQILHTAGGVFAPEHIFDPALALGKLKEMGIVTYADLEMTQPLL